MNSIIICPPIQFIKKILIKYGKIISIHTEYIKNRYSKNIQNIEQLIYFIQNYIKEFYILEAQSYIINILNILIIIYAIIMQIIMNRTIERYIR